MAPPTRTVAIVTPVLACIVISGCARSAAQPAEPPKAKVSVAQVITRDVTEFDEFTGRLEAVTTVELRPRVSGYIASVGFVEGAVVRRGDVLFEIDARPFQAEVDRLRADLLAAHAAAERADSELKRAERLDGENAISREEHQRRGAVAKESTAQVDSTEAALRVAELNLEWTKVTAPIDGRVGRAIVKEGNLVSNGPSDATLLTTIVSLDPIYASFDVDEHAFLRILAPTRESKQGDARQARIAIRLALATDTDFPREGTMSFLDNSVDPATGTIRARATFRNSDRSLTPGLFVRVRLPASEAQRAILIQDSAIGTDLDKRFVLVVTADHAVEYRVVTLGPVIDDLRVVRSGLKTGEQVIVDGLQRARPGSHVDVETVSMDAPPAAADANTSQGGR